MPKTQVYTQNHPKYNVKSNKHNTFGKAAVPHWTRYHTAVAAADLPIGLGLFKERLHEKVWLVQEGVVPSLWNTGDKQIGGSQLPPFLPDLPTHPSSPLWIHPISFAIDECDWHLHRDGSRVRFFFLAFLFLGHGVLRTCLSTLLQLAWAGYL